MVLITFADASVSFEDIAGSLNPSCELRSTAEQWPQSHSTRSKRFSLFSDSIAHRCNQFSGAGLRFQTSLQRLLVFSNTTRRCSSHRRTRDYDTMRHDLRDHVLTTQQARTCSMTVTLLQEPQAPRMAFIRCLLRLVIAWHPPRHRRYPEPYLTHTTVRAGA